VTDLRLVPATLAAWTTAALAVGAPGPDVLLSTSVGAVALALLALAAVTPSARVASTGTPSTGTPSAGAPVVVGRVESVRARAAGQAVLVAACVVAVLLSTGAQLAARSGLAELAADGATASVTATVGSAVEPRTNPWTGVPDRSEVRVELREVTARGVRSAAAGPVVVSGPGGGWDGLVYGSTVEARGVLAVQGDRTLLRVEEAPRVVEPPGPLSRGVHAMRQGLLAATDGLSPQARGLVPGVAVGDTSRLDPALDEAMRTTSLTHATAVSGGHFAIVVACVAALCVVARAPRTLRVAVTAAAMAGFVVLVHPEPSVLRAAAMGAVGVVGIALGRPSRAVAALGAGVVLLLVVDPWLARSYGFVLSVAATAGLALLTAPIARRLAPWCGRVAAHVVAVPVAAQVACAPILVLLDPSVSTWAVPANLLAAPALGPATVLAVLATLVAPWWPAGATAVAWVAGGFTWWIAGVAQVFAGLPGARLPWPGGAGGLVLLAAVTGAVAAVVTRSRALAALGERQAARRASALPWRARARRRVRAVRRALTGSSRAARRHRQVTATLVAAVGVLAAVVLVLVRPLVTTGGLVSADVPADWAVVACDVGQGDALVLRSGPVSAVVVDVGPAGDAADRCLDGLGVDHVDLLVLSHFHADHVGGLEPVLRGRTVDRALVTGTADPAAQAERVRELLDDAGVRVDVARPGETGEAGAAGVRWEVLQAGPVHGADEAGTGTGGAAHHDGEDGGANDASIALLAVVEGVDVVALGDLEDAGQDALASSLTASGTGRVDVVKVAHHGSATQSERLAAVLAPAVALVSSGENTYGHPTDRALDLYRGVGASVLRTDTCGTFALVVRDGVLGAAGC
jgi:competence protein ComEC